MTDPDPTPRRPVPIRLSPTRTVSGADGAGGVSWREFERAEPAFADELRKRFEQYDRHILATFMLVGGPRVSGAEVLWDDSDLLLTAMARTPKVADLRADPRFEIHINPGPEPGAFPDFRIRGTVVELPDSHRAAQGTVGRPGANDGSLLFRLNLTRVLRSHPSEDQAEVAEWRPGRALEVQLRE